MNIGERIKEIRLKKGITQKELAKMLGIATNSLSRYEIGERIPNLEMIKKIADALSVSPSVLIFGEVDSLAYALLSDNNEIVNAVTQGLPNGNKWRQESVDAIKREIERLRNDTIEKYDSLNIAGQEKANGYITALAETKEYTTPDKALQESEDSNE